MILLPLLFSVQSSNTGGLDFVDLVTGSSEEWQIESRTEGKKRRLAEDNQSASFGDTRGSYYGYISGSYSSDGGSGNVASYSGRGSYENDQLHNYGGSYTNDGTTNNDNGSYSNDLPINDQFEGSGKDYKDGFNGGGTGLRTESIVAIVLVVCLVAVLVLGSILRYNKCPLNESLREKDEGGTFDQEGPGSRTNSSRLDGNNRLTRLPTASGEILHSAATTGRAGNTGNTEEQLERNSVDLDEKKPTCELDHSSVETDWNPPPVLETVANRRASQVTMVTEISLPVVSMEGRKTNRNSLREMEQFRSRGTDSPVYATCSHFLVFPCFLLLEGHGAASQAIVIPGRANENTRASNREENTVRLYSASCRGSGKPATATRHCKHTAAATITTTLTSCCIDGF
jgi:hypothetical protein